MKRQPFYTPARDPSGKLYWLLRGKRADLVDVETRLFPEAFLEFVDGGPHGRFFRHQQMDPIRQRITYFSSYCLDCEHAAWVHEYPDGSGMVTLSAGETAFGANGNSSTGITVPVNLIDYPTLELRIAQITPKIRAHPHYLRRAWGLKDEKTCEVRGPDWLLQFVS